MPCARCWGRARLKARQEENMLNDTEKKTLEDEIAKAISEARLEES
jgi:hypothetical protein